MARPLRMMVLAPGHFHAALVLKEMLPEVYPRVYVYSPLNDDLIRYVTKVNGFNHRSINPSNWQLDIRASDDYLQRYLREQPGNLVVIAGRNRPKIDRILSAVTNNCHVLVDKPWIIDHSDFPKLQEVFRQVDIRETLVGDMMTERHEVTSRLQRDLIHDPEIVGHLESGSLDEPMCSLESTHHLMKNVAGKPLLRPTWWYDRSEAGSALADISTHLVDLSLWMLFLNQLILHDRDAKVISAREWPLILSREQFAASTGVAEFPRELAGQIVDGQLHYAGCGEMNYSIRGFHVRVQVEWKYDRGPGIDSHRAVVRGSQARVEIRTTHQPDVYVVANNPKDHTRVLNAVTARINHWQARHSGCRVEDHGSEIHVEIPKKYRNDHEDHFAEVLDNFIRDTRNVRRAMQTEQYLIMTKYYITSLAARMARNA